MHRQQRLDRGGIEADMGDTLTLTLSRFNQTFGQQGPVGIGPRCDKSQPVNGVLDDSPNQSFQGNFVLVLEFVPYEQQNSHLFTQVVLLVVEVMDEGTALLLGNLVVQSLNILGLVKGVIGFLGTLDAGPQQAIFIVALSQIQVFNPTAAQVI